MCTILSGGGKGTITAGTQRVLIPQIRTASSVRTCPSRKGLPTSVSPSTSAASSVRIRMDFSAAWVMWGGKARGMAMSNADERRMFMQRAVLQRRNDQQHVLVKWRSCRCMSHDVRRALTAAALAAPATKSPTAKDASGTIPSIAAAAVRSDALPLSLEN